MWTSLFQCPQSFWSLSIGIYYYLKTQWGFNTLIITINCVLWFWCLSREETVTFKTSIIGPFPSSFSSGMFCVFYDISEILFLFYFFATFNFCSTIVCSASFFLFVSLITWKRNYYFKRLLAPLFKCQYLLIEICQKSILRIWVIEWDHLGFAFSLQMESLRFSKDAAQWDVVCSLCSFFA